MSFSVAPVANLTLAGMTTPTVGDSVTLNCDITPGTPTAQVITWYRDGVLVTGESQATYTFTSLLADQGVSYECRVNNGMEDMDSINLELLGMKGCLQCEVT